MSAYYLTYCRFIPTVQREEAFDELRDALTCYQFNAVVGRNPVCFITEVCFCGDHTHTVLFRMFLALSHT